MHMYSQYDTLIIIGETGSGKTTQVPKFIYEHERGQNRKGSKRVCVTQPRRVAAMSLAKRVAEEMSTTLGTLVGYSVRFEELYSKETMIKYVTDGMLLRELLSDRLLSRYRCIVLDEAHERTVRTDILFGMIRLAQEARACSPHQPLKVVIMSATIDPSRFASFFSNVGVCTIPGRMHPVRIRYTVEPQTDYVDSTVLTIFQVHLDAANQASGGDILVFLTGQEEIESVAQVVGEYAAQMPPSASRLQLTVCPLYATLPAHQQMSVFQPPAKGHRKVILATNIAETSITISGIKFVIDCGFVKQREFNARTGLESLVIRPISKASARQRAGRAGRETSGECLRLYPEEEFLKLSEEAVPEIHRTHLAQVVLMLKACGVDDPLSFPFLESPSLEGLKRGLEELLALGAVEAKGGALTARGRVMAECPLLPPLARTLLAGAQFKCLAVVLDIISLLSVADTLFITSVDDRDRVAAARKLFKHRTGDHWTLAMVYSKWRAHRQDPSWPQAMCLDPRALKQADLVREQLKEFCEKHQMPLDITLDSNEATEVAVLKAFLTGFFRQTAMRHSDNTYHTILGKQHVHIHPSSVLFNSRPDCILYHELTLTTKCYLRIVSVVDSGWVAESMKESLKA